VSIGELLVPEQQHVQPTAVSVLSGGCTTPGGTECVVSWCWHRYVTRYHEAPGQRTAAQRHRQRRHLLGVAGVNPVALGVVVALDGRRVSTARWQPAAWSPPVCCCRHAFGAGAELHGLGDHFLLLVVLLCRSGFILSRLPTRGGSAWGTSVWTCTARREDSQEAGGGSSDIQRVDFFNLASPVQC
jgi:hypothetical protein